MAKVLFGKPIAEGILKKLAKAAKNRRLKLAVVQVGSNAVSKKYIKEKQKACRQTGIGFTLFLFPANIRQGALEKKVREIVRNPRITGVVIQLPLPSGLFAQKILDCVPPAKDPDVLSSRAFALFQKGKLGILPPVVGAVWALLLAYKISLHNKQVLLVGSGKLVGKPLEVWFLQKGIVPAVADKSVKFLSKKLAEADIVVSGTGKAGLIQGGMIKKGAVVIDAGTSVERGRTKGDVDFQSAFQKARFITPVPGGVGPLTVACLLKNIVMLGIIGKR